jgi:hypothetical protein
MRFVRLMLGQVLTMDDQVADSMAEVADGSAARIRSLDLGRD